MISRHITGFSLAHLTHFLCCPGTAALNTLKLIESLFCFYCCDITKEILDNCLDWSRRTICGAKSSIVRERIFDFYFPTTHWVSQSGIHLLPEVVLFITCCCLILDCKSVKFFEVLISLLPSGLVMEGPVCEELANTLFVRRRCISI
jgi:hypothetical protein